MSGDSANRSCGRIFFYGWWRRRLRPLRRPTVSPPIEAARLLLAVFPENYPPRIRVCLSIRSKSSRTLSLRVIRRVIHSAQKLLGAVPAVLVVFFRPLCVRPRFPKDIPREPADRAARGRRRSVGCFF